MAGKGKGRLWREAARILVAQAILATIAAAVLGVIWGWAAAGWALTGGFISLGPSAVFAVRLNRAAQARTNFGIALALGELLKVVLVAALFAAMYSRAREIDALALLLGFIAAVQGYFLASLVPDRLIDR